MATAQTAATPGYLVCGGDVLSPYGWQEYDLGIVDGRIADRVGPGGQIVDATGLKIVPGFIDLQINGGWGHDLQREPASLWVLARRLVETGVTTFLPTLTTNGHRRRREALAVWSHGPSDRSTYLGADPLGWHLEGPWLAPSRHGAHDRALLQPLPPLAPADYHRDGGVRMVTLAPELADALPVITELARRGVVVACGHSEADVETARAAFDAGATVGTHLFNAMSGLDHRSVGLAGALLLEDSAYLGLITDGVHVAPEMIELAWRLASDRIVLVSDAVAQMGTIGSDPASAHRLEDGTLAGSLTSLDRALTNLMRFTDCSLIEAVRTVTETPARALGLTDRGRIGVGLRADLVGLDPDGRVVLTFVNGRLAYDRR
ncbi:MAG: N-acetylglucosamine-6-phosphate deacetylase [Acidimicrobiales bacterium]